MDIDEPEGKRLEINGATNSKRKARNSLNNRKSYKEASDEDDEEKPLVCISGAVL